MIRNGRPPLLAYCRVTTLMSFIFVNNPFSGNDLLIYITVIIFQKMNSTQAENDKFTKENASLIRVIGKLSNKVKPR